MGRTAGVGLLILLAASRAAAASPAAEALFREGRLLMAAGNTAEACARFAQSYALEAASGTLLNLALCHEKQGKVATAWAEYREAAALARGQDRTDRAAVADERVAALEPRVARVRLVAVKPQPGLEVSGEEEGLTALSLDVAIPIDPGVYHLRVKAPARRPRTITLKISEAEQRRVEIPALDDEAIAVPVLVAVSAPPPTASARSRGSFDLYLGASGGLVVAGGAVVWGIAYSKFQSAKEVCNHGLGCADHDQRVATIRTLEGIAIGSWIAGGAAIVVSVLHHELRKPPALVQVSFDPASRQLGIGGVF